MFKEMYENKSQAEIQESIMALEMGLVHLTAKPDTKQNQQVKQELSDALKEARLHLHSGSLTMPDNTVLGMTGSVGEYRRTEGVSVGGASYKNLFGNPEKNKKGGFKSFGEMLWVAKSGRHDPRLNLEIINTQQSGIPSTGGFLVPDQFSSEILDSALPNEVARKLSTVYPMTAETLIIPGFDAKDMSSGANAGLTMNFYGEGAEASAQTAQFRQIQMNAHTAGIYVNSSLELTQDGINFDKTIGSVLSKSVGYGFDRHLIGSAGTGAGCPLSVLNSACKISVPKETGQSADTIQYSNLKQMFARQLNPENAVWIINPSSIPELLEITISVGTGGSAVSLLNEKDGRFTIFGRPCYFTPVVPALGNDGDILFVCFDFMAIGLRKEVYLEHTDAVRWLQRERSYRILVRFDGMCTLDSEITPENGNTLSPIVSLAVRE